MTKTQITIEKMERAERAGDWHDAPLRWIVKGPLAEAQKFSTKAEATLYARLRRNNSFSEALRKYINS
jgi:hypothetical protein